MDENITYENQEIDLREFFRVFWNFRYKILISAIFVSLLFLGFSLFIPDTYESKAILKVEDETNNSGGMSSLVSQYAGIASLAGISIPSAGESKSSYIIETIKSKEFLKHLLKFDDIKINLVAAKSFDKNTKQIIYDSSIYNKELKKWTRKAPNQRQRIPSYLEVYEDFYINNINVSQDKLSGFISITFNHISPYFAKDIIDLIIREVNSVIRNKDMNQSKRSLDYLELRLRETSNKDILDSINALISTQLKVQVLSNTKESYALSSIDMPYIPELKAGPNRIYFLVIGLLLGFVTSSFFFLTRHYLFSN